MNREQERLPLGVEDAFYCGCWRQAGHYVFGPGMRAVHGIRERELAKGLDAPYVPKDTYKQGAAKLTHLTGWTILAFADNTVDDRPGSHSTFALRGQHDFEGAVAVAQATFPEVFARFDFPITLHAAALPGTGIRTTE